MEVNKVASRAINQLKIHVSFFDLKTHTLIYTHTHILTHIHIHTHTHTLAL